MIAFLKTLLLLPVVVVVLLLAIANRAPVTVSLDPFSKGAPEIAATIPLYGLLFGAVALGILIGGAGAWLGAGRHRRSGRASRREAKRLRAEAEQLRTALATDRGVALPAPGRRYA